ncbi:MAG: hypothetical protein MR598_06895 [Erysipelotrichaceae bacterium]|nr:hypothetical protein [Erysipelotrichaceae bacterium]
MNEQKNNGRGIFYGVIGVATLVVAIIGATFAYFTATAGDNNVIRGNMATIQFGLNVTKVTHVDESKGGMIPMSNNMVEAAVTDSGVSYDPDGTPDSGDEFTGAGQTCVDDNGNAVCQIYKIVVTNTGSASLFLDGYISLFGGSGTPTDIGTKGANITPTPTNMTSMRWAQVDCKGTETNEITKCTTRMKTQTGATTSGGNAAGIDKEWSALGNSSDSTGFDKDNILTASVTAKGNISGNEYDIINRNYIRISNHAAEATGYDRTADVTSALVFNQYLDAAGGTAPTATYYFVVWLSETGTNQTAGAEGAAESALSFFTGNVAFNSAQGSEVTATFNGYAAVPSDQLTP